MEVPFNFRLLFLNDLLSGCACWKKCSFKRKDLFLIILLVGFLISILFWIISLNNRREFPMVRINVTLPAYSNSSFEHRNHDRWKELQTKFAQINFSLLLLPSPIPPKVVKFQCTSICGGLGDRIRGLIMAYFFAILSNRRLVVDMRWPCSFTDYFQGNLYPWISSSDLSINGSWLYIRAIDHNTVLMNELKATSFVEKWSRYDNIELSTNMDFLSTIFSNPRVRSNPVIEMFLRIMSPEQANIQTLFPLFYNILFRPTDRITRDLDQILAGKSTDNLLCTHLRIGRNPSNPRDSAFQYSVNMTREVIHFISKNRFLEKDPSRLLFVSSDSIDVTKEVTNYFVNRSFSVPGPVLQIDLPANGVNCNDGFVKVVLDFYLLGECETVILGNSGFSAFANRRRKDPYRNLYKYDQKENRVEKCLDLRSPEGWEHSRSVFTKLFCPVMGNNFTYNEVI